MGAAKRYKVRVIYKSGYAIDLECERFVCEHNSQGKLSKLTWHNARPDPLFIGVDEVAAIYELL